MKAFKGFILVGFLGGLLTACFDAPEFSNTPEITFKNIEFKETPAAGVSDTLILYLDFKDGDGNLGLDPENSFDWEFPYNDVFYYLATDPDATNPKDRMDSLSAFRVEDTDNKLYLLLLPQNPDFKGPVIIDKTRNEPGYDFLPVFEPLSTCGAIPTDLHYSTTELLIPESLNAVDETYNILDTLYDGLDNEYYLVKEPFYYRMNPNHYNIEVEFYYLENGDWKYYDWYANFCTHFNGRFPLPGEGNRPLEGTMRYAMENTGFKAVFGAKTLKLRITIRDRALQTSNTVETRLFTLDGI